MKGSSSSSCVQASASTLISTIYDPRQGPAALDYEPAAARETAAASHAASAPSHPTAIVSPDNSILETATTRPGSMLAPRQATARGSGHDLGGCDWWTEA